MVMPQEHGPRHHPENAHWEYTAILQLNSGQIQVLQPDGSVGVVPNQHIVGALNDFGKQGWEVIQGHPILIPVASRTF